MATEIKNLNYFLSSIPVKVRLRTGEIVVREHMSGNCNTILSAFIDMKQKGQKAQPSLKSLANLIGGSVRTVIRSLDTLEISGLIDRTRRGCGLTNLYRISLWLWKRLFVGLKHGFNKVKMEDEFLPDKSKYVQPYHPPAPRGERTVASTMEHSAALDFLENHYEEAIKPI